MWGVRATGSFQGLWHFCRASWRFQFEFSCAFAIIPFSNIFRKFGSFGGKPSASHPSPKENHGPSDGQLIVHGPILWVTACALGFPYLRVVRVFILSRKHRESICKYWSWTVQEICSWFYLDHWIFLKESHGWITMIKTLYLQNIPIGYVGCEICLLS